MDDKNTPNPDDDLPESDNEETGEMHGHLFGVPEIIFVDNGTSFFQNP